MTNLENRFHADMLKIYENAKRECNYAATRFLVMVHERGGVGAARQLLAASTISEGFVRLWEMGHLDTHRRQVEHLSCLIATGRHFSQRSLAMDTLPHRMHAVCVPSLAVAEGW